MKANIKVGDLVETCSLMAGVVMKKNGDDIEVRMLDVDEYSSDSYSCCSLGHCGIVKLTAKEALDRLMLGKERLTEIWRSLDDCEDDDIGPEYSRRIEAAVAALK